jgi:hypothetical protein
MTLLWDSEPHQQQIRRGAPLPEVTISSFSAPSSRRASPQIGSSSPAAASVAILTTSASCRPFTTCYNAYRSLKSRHSSSSSSAAVSDENQYAAAALSSRHGSPKTPAAVRIRASSNTSSPNRRVSSSPTSRRRDGETYPSPSHAVRMTSSPPRHHHRRSSQHNSPLIITRRIAEDRSVATDLLNASKQFRDIFLPSTGKRAVNVMSLFHQSLHLPDADREILLTTMNRCQHFMSEVEGLLRSSVDNQVALDRSVVHFSYLRWGEAHELCRGVKKVLQHRHSGVTMYFPDGAPCSSGGGAAVVVPSVVQRRGGVSPARAVMSRGTNSAGERRGGQNATPTSFRRLCAHALPTFESIASRWAPKFSMSPRRVGYHHHQHAAPSGKPDDNSGSWRSAVDELREKELRETEYRLFQLLLSLPAETPEEMVTLKQRQKLTVLDDCMALLHRIQNLLAELNRAGNSGDDDGDENAAFLMWLTTVSPKLLVKIEGILIVNHQSD